MLASSKQIDTPAHTLANETSPIMTRHGGSDNAASPSIIIHASSIALLRERFRNLQKVKEMRQGRELQRRARTAHTTDRAAGPSPSPSALSLGLHAANSSTTQQPSRWFLHPDLVRPSRPLRGPAYHHHGLIIAASAVQPPPPPSSWGGTTTTQNYSGYRSDVVVDVDTSLHL
ncbi:uncharacterized protein [Zea mays]|jgi:hypothetical protein|nr:uncharacterized protein LOC103639482 [Zea mays]|eukprot:XP_008660454.1 uncharacterized protein LOC103639482 [Zea mays]